jgi:hypothetical protein
MQRRLMVMMGINTRPYNAKKNYKKYAFETLQGKQGTASTQHRFVTRSEHLNF